MIFTVKIMVADFLSILRNEYHHFCLNSCKWKKIAALFLSFIAINFSLDIKRPLILLFQITVWCKTGMMNSF